MQPLISIARELFHRNDAILHLCNTTFICREPSFRRESVLALLRAIVARRYGNPSAIIGLENIRISRLNEQANDS